MKWLRRNKISLNTGKTELIFFHSSRHQLDYDNIYINFNGVRLKPVDFIEYLGMFIDKCLNWNHHITNLSKQLSRANGVLSKLRYNASLEFCLQVCYAIFYSHLTSGCNFWASLRKKILANLKIFEVNVFVS